MYLQQVSVQQHQKQLVTWIPCDKRVRPGVLIELKGEEGLWRVDHLYSKLDSSLLNRSWSVGGL